MDFGGFFLFIGACIGCFFLVYLGFFAQESASRIPARIMLLIAILPTVVLGWWLYRVYFLDEGLLATCGRHDAAAVKALLNKGANPNAEWETGEHALTFAGDDSAILKLLIEKGAGVNAHNPRGITALNRAKAQGYPHAVAILRRAGAKD